MVLCPLFPSPPSTALCSTSTALYPIYGPLSYDPLFPPLYGPLSPLRPSVLSRPFPFYYPLSPLQLFSLLWPSVPSGALCPLYGPLSPLQPSVPSMALCSLYGPLSPLGPSVPSTALCPRWKTAKQAKQPSCFAKCFEKRVSSKLQGLLWSILFKW